MAVKPRLMLIGSSGRLAKCWFDFNSNYNLYNIQGISRKKTSFTEIQCDSTNLVQLTHAINDFKPNIIINTAAMTNVELCESSLEEAYRANTLIPKNIVSSINSLNLPIKLIQISSDQVYSSQSYADLGDESPTNIYAKTKLEGDLEALKLSKSLVIRTNFLYVDQVEWLKNKCNNNNFFNLFNDVIFNPIEINQACLFIHSMIKNNMIGIYNLGSRDGISKAKFFLAIAKKLNLNTAKAKLISINDAELIAKRPTDMTINVARLEDELGIKLPTINNSIDYLMQTL